jgi:hypothetical protein
MSGWILVIAIVFWMPDVPPKLVTTGIAHETWSACETERELVMARLAYNHDAIVMSECKQVVETKH